MMYGSLVLSVSGSNSTAFGNDHDNQISATTGTNVFHGGDGDDTIVGGSGLDTVVFDGDIADFIITQGAGATIDVAHAASGAPGTDNVANVEVLQFNDGSIDTDTLGFVI